ncbi:HAD-IA family hydrolase [Lacimicrobium sp. SS2-24]|uniref:HAD family hydrolase n=1 Tax=Lacimicrobium sp. SS2-24 TaxID=2005569 RepID=UPI000B4A6863|nr:HAD-IA family hydrolase [Lacimicrobium sp. SS2-24]
MTDIISPKAMLFDLDGTLLDTARDMGNALNKMLAQYALPLREYDEYRPIASHGAKGMLALGFGNTLADFSYDTLRAEFLSHYEQQLQHHTCLFNGVRQVIEGLHSANLPWGIVTNKPGYLTTNLLSHYPELRQAHIIISGDTLPQRKPHPAQLVKAQQHIGVAAEQIWYVGDAERDIQAARAATMVPVLAEYGYICPSEGPEHWDTALRIQSPDALLEYLN